MFSLRIIRHGESMSENIANNYYWDKWLYDTAYRLHSFFISNLDISLFNLGMNDKERGKFIDSVQYHINNKDITFSGSYAGISDDSKVKIKSVWDSVVEDTKKESKRQYRLLLSKIALNKQVLS